MSCLKYFFYNVYNTYSVNYKNRKTKHEVHHDVMSNVTCLIVVKCLWRQSSQPLTGLRGPTSKVLAANVIGIKELESNNI